MIFRSNRKLVKVSFWIYFIFVVIVNIYPKLNDYQTISEMSKLRLDYVIHFLLYAMLAILFVLYSSKSYNYFIPVSLIVFAAISEVFQTFVPGRTFNVYDMLYNIIGVVFGYFLILIINKRIFIQHEG